MSKPLIVYYSRKGQNYVNGTIRNLQKGNTQVVAEIIASLTNGDLFELDTRKPYSTDYTTCTEEAMAELKANARPELKTLPEGLDGYDTIFLGYPNWWGTMPMCVGTFLESFDFAGKTICPFCTNEGSGLGNSERDLKKLCPAATVKPGLSIHGAEATDSGKKVESWVKKLGF